MADDFQSKTMDLMRKVLTVGVGALFLTEESLRALVSEFKLPKDLISAVLDSANNTKDEFFQILSKEITSKIVGRVDPVALLQGLLRNNEIELQIKMSFKPKSESSN